MPEAGLEMVGAHLAQGDLPRALLTLLPLLEAAADPLCTAAARLLRAQDEAAAAPAALAAALDRLVTLVDRQNEQIRALRALLEPTL